MYDYTTVTRERLHGYDKFLSETCTSTDDPGHLRPCTTTVAENRQVHLYLVFGIAKNVKYPFEMTRSASSNDPKYLFETTEFYYHRPAKPCGRQIPCR